MLKITDFNSDELFEVSFRFKCNDSESKWNLPLSIKTFLTPFVNHFKMVKCLSLDCITKT